MQLATVVRPGLLQLVEPANNITDQRAANSHFLHTKWAIHTDAHEAELEP